jgi:hypothetical protein
MNSNYFFWKNILKNLNNNKGKMVQAYLFTLDTSTENPVLGSAITNLSSFTATPQDFGQNFGFIGIAIVGDKSNGIKSIKVTVNGLIDLLVGPAKLSGTSLNMIDENAYFDNSLTQSQKISSPFTTPELRVPKGADVAMTIMVNGVTQSTISIDITYYTSDSQSQSEEKKDLKSNHKLWMWLSIGGVILLLVIVALIYWSKTKKAAKTLSYRRR